MVIERTDLSQQVLSVLRRDIIQGTYRPGERLHVERIAARLDVSPTPVKNALGRLATEGLVAFGPRGGAFVTSLTPSEIDEVFEIREMIELHAAAKAVDAASTEDCEHLEHLAESLRSRIRTDGSADQEGFAADDMAFHAYLVGLSGNQRLARLYESLHVYTIVVRTHALVNDDTPTVATGARYLEVYREHLAIVDALRNNDSAALRSAIAHHLSIVRQHAHRALSDQHPANNGLAPMKGGSTSRVHH
jgi:DNA-binding GntR family transcriptional regulator